MDNVLYQENMLCPIILGHICRWKILKLRDFMFLQGRGTLICDFTGIFQLQIWPKMIEHNIFS